MVALQPHLLEVLEAPVRIIAMMAVSAAVLGLLGVLLGAVDAIARASALGPGISPAVAEGLLNSLLPAAMGLIVAVPAAAGYVLLRRKMQRLRTDMDVFEHDLFAGIGRRYLPSDEAQGKTS